MAEDDYTADSMESGGEAAPEQSDLTRKLISWIKKDMTHVSAWRKEAREDFNFYAGNQWSEEDLNELRAKMRPALTFNRIAPLVNAITGSEINNRREVRFIPREAGDAQANEVLSSAAEWFRDECGAEDEESDAFQDAIISGMGWTDTRLDFEDDPDGAPKIERMDPLEMGWDCYAVKPNLEDARRMWRVREMAYEDAVDLTGEKDKGKLHAAWIKDLGDSPEAHDQDRADDYEGGQNDLADGGYGKYKCLVVEIRWFEKQTYYRGPDIEGMQEIREYDERQVKLIRKEMPEFPAVRQTRKVMKRAFIGSQVLGEPDQPLVPPGLFGWECITGYFDKIKSQFYGVVKTAKDPQRWSNKFFSQVMFLLNSQSKGGIIAERGAFEDDRQAEASWAKADEITWANGGTISGDKPKILPKSPASFPAGFFTLFQESKEAINDVTGLSMEFLGTREVDQAGVLEYQRRQSSLNLLASLFNSLRRYRKRQGREMLFLIQEHLSDGRLIRIVGDDMKQYVPLMKADVANKKYDIIVDDSPSSPNEKDRTWQILMQFLPLVKDLVASDPEAMMEVLAASPLPASFVEKLKRMMQQRAQQPQPPSPEEIKAQAEQQKFQMEMQGKQLEMAGKQTEMQAKQAETGMNLQAKQQEAAIDTEMKGIDLMIEQQKAQNEMIVEEQKLANDMQRLAIEAEKNKIARQNAAAQRTKAATQ